MQINWFDFLVVALLIVGLIRGKQRGMSEELLDLFQWLLIVVVAGLAYKPVGDFFARTMGIPLLAAHIAGYVVWFVVFVLVFGWIKKMVGEKLVHSDAFGILEYYLGMLSGMVRYACMILFGASILHAVYISPLEREQQAKAQKESFGSISFPTLASLQQSVFVESTSGAFVERTFTEQLIHPVGGSAPSPTIGNRRQSLFEEAGR